MSKPITGTHTSDGFIPYLNKHGIGMPVALEIHKDAPVSLLRMPQRPMRDVNGDLFYVAPGSTADHLILELA